MTLIALTVYTMQAVALAQDVYAEPPPAIPAQTEEPRALPAQGRAPDLNALRRPPERSPERLQALRQYQDERLTVRTETEFHGGGAMVVGGVWGGGYRPGPYGGVRYGWSIPGAVISEPVTVEHGWGVYRGPERLTTPDILRAGGEVERADDLDRDIRRAKLASNLWLGVAGVGVATAISGMMGQSIAESRDEAIFFNNVTLGGVGVAAVGVIGGSFPATRARALRYEPDRTLSLQETQELVRKNNETLRRNLGLTPDDVWQVESAPPPGR